MLCCLFNIFQSWILHMTILSDCTICYAIGYVIRYVISFAAGYRIEHWLLCHLLYHQIYHSLPIGYSTLALTLARLLVMVFCHLLYHHIFHCLFLWYVTSYCIGCAISNVIFNAINFDLKNHYIYGFIIFGHVYAFDFEY